MLKRYLTSLLACLIILAITITSFVRQAITTFSSGTETETDVEKGHKIEQEILNGIVEGNGLKDTIDDFTNQLVGKGRGAKYASALSVWISRNEYVESTEVLLGKDNWLFYKTTSDGNPIADYQGTNHYDEDTLKVTAQNLMHVRNTIESYGTEFIVMSIPNKETVYSEYMPDTIVQLNSESKTDLLLDYLEENTNLTIIDAKPALLAEKGSYQLYRKTDTHFNEIGSFIATQTLKKSVDGNCEALEDVKFDIIGEDCAGDLAQLCNMEDIFNYDTIYTIDPASVTVSLKSDKKILFIGDSFGLEMENVMSNYFAEVDFVNVWSFDMDLISQYQPDIVVWESVERYTDRFNWDDITQ